MAGELKYTVRLKADTSGAREVVAAMTAMDRNAGELTQSYVALRGAAQGNILGIANLTRQIGFLSTAAKGAQAAMGWLGIVLALAQAAWSLFREKQQKAAGEIKEATDRLTAAQVRLNEAIAASKKPDYKPHIEALRELGDAFDSAAAAAKNLGEAQRQIAAAQTDTALARISAAEQKALREVAPGPDAEDERAEISLTAARDRAQVKYEADLIALDKRAVALDEELAGLKNQGNALTIQRMNAENFGPLNEAQAALDALEARQAKLKKGWFEPGAGWQKGRALTGEETDEHTNALKLRNEYKGQQEQLLLSLADQLTAVAARREALLAQKSTLPAERERLGAEYSAQESADFAADAARVAARDKAMAERSEAERNKQDKERLGAEAASGMESVKDQADRAAADRARDITNARRVADAMQAESERLQERVMSPAARKRQDRAAREKSKENERLDKRLAAAEDAEARGARGAWIEDVKKLKDARTLAHEKKLELAALETASMRAQVETPLKLDAIKTMLEKTLSSAA